MSQIEEVKGRFPQVVGLKFTFDSTMVSNDGRIREVMVQTASGFEAIDPAATYSIVTNNHVRNGGDG